MFDPDREETTVGWLRELGLTAQQARVLFWCIQGKTSPEIGIILAARPRTIHKHLENIYLRLGVCTRAGAIGRVIERLTGAPGAGGHEGTKRTKNTKEE